MKVDEVKVWGGGASVIVVLLIGVVVTVLAMDSNKNSAFQGVAQICKLEKSEICNDLIKFGVSPELYLSDKDYQNSVDIKAVKAIESNSLMAGPLASFTLEYAGNKNVKLAVKVIEKLEELSESSK